MNHQNPLINLSLKNHLDLQNLIKEQRNYKFSIATSILWIGLFTFFGIDYYKQDSYILFSLCLFLSLSSCANIASTCKNIRERNVLIEHGKFNESVYMGVLNEYGFGHQIKEIKEKL
jgi:hypothetical protein